MLLELQEVKKLAAEYGFDLCGITQAELLQSGEKKFRAWLEQGRGEGLEYLRNHSDLRFDTSKLVEGAKSVIVCAINYKSEYSLAEPHCGIASYALMRDYHKTIRKRLKTLLKELNVRFSVQGRVFTDSAPLLEKGLAVKAGLGWIGRQSLLVTPQFGTYVLLGEIVIDGEFDQYDTPSQQSCPDGCRKCVDNCPTQAIGNDKTIDARRCIASRTIEFEDCGDPETLYGWLFGCDICQRSCPRNAATPLFCNLDMQPILTPPTLDDWKEMSQAEFEEYTAGTPLRRSSAIRIKSAIIT